MDDANTSAKNQTSGAQGGQEELWYLAHVTWGLFKEAPAQHIGAIVAIMLGSALTLGLAYGPLLVGYVRGIEGQRQGDPITMDCLARGLSSTGAAMILSIVYTGAVAVGGLLGVLPGVLIAFVWSFGLWFVALRDANVIEALSRSFRLTLTHRGPALLLFIALVALNAAGVFALGIGVLISCPLTFIAMTAAFADFDAATTAPDESAP